MVPVTSTVPTPTVSGSATVSPTPVDAVAAAVFDDDSDSWRVDLESGESLTARFLVNASGVLTVPKPPDIAGVGDFAGLTMHTARWDHDQDLTGKRVAIIGTGASAVQVIPEIAPIMLTQA